MHVWIFLISRTYISISIHFMKFPRFQLMYVKLLFSLFLNEISVRAPSLETSNTRSTILNFFLSVFRAIHTYHYLWPLLGHNLAIFSVLFCSLATTLFFLLSSLFLTVFLANYLKKFLKNHQFYNFYILTISYFLIYNMQFYFYYHFLHIALQLVAISWPELGYFCTHSMCRYVK